MKSFLQSGSYCQNRLNISSYLLKDTQTETRVPGHQAAEALVQCSACCRLCMLGLEQSCKPLKSPKTY